ncbi:MAG: circularly permuted type 2 ATP-grasp protein [Oceanipulchritudo sp.]
MGQSKLDRLETRANEVYDPSGRRDLYYRHCTELVKRLHAPELRRREAFINRATADLGLHADRLGRGGDDAGGFSMDLFPRILRPREWEHIESGVLQRVRAFSAYIRDIYGGREILRLKKIPPEIAFEDPAFHTELHGVPMDAANPVTIAAVDLVRTSGGRWMVLENRFSTPTGISYVIQTRRILAQALPEIFGKLPVYPVASFATRLSEALAEQARDSRAQPLVVLLSEGESGSHFFEESFMARHMGIPLARPGDMVVREGRVFLKTVEGLHPVDVIYRRLEPSRLDPVAFATGDQNGVPGLVQCVREGTVRIANALGCAVADNRALLRHADTLIRHYSGEHPILPTVDTWHGFDIDQRDWIMENLDRVVLRTVCHPETLRHSHPDAYRLTLAGRLTRLLRKDPRLVVAQQLPEGSRVPVFRDGEFSLGEVTMRVYCLMGSRPYVLPGGLTRLRQPGHEKLPMGPHFHALKDTWALREHQSRTGRTGRLEPELTIPETPLTSRAAEAFYWMGRYLERARGTARMLNTLGELRWGELVPSERELYTPLLKAIMEATSQKTSLQNRSGDLRKVTTALLHDSGNPASVRSCMASVQFNASTIRSFITPEVWKSITDTAAILQDPPSTPLSETALRETLEGLVAAADRIYGAGHRTLLHDAGWQFLNIGMFLERAITNIVILSGVLPHIVERQWKHLRDDTDLTALLRLAGALDAYHRKYRSRAYLDRVAQLLWIAPSCTASVAFASSSILGALHSLSANSGGRIRTAGIAAEVKAFHEWLAGLSLPQIFPARTLELDRGLTRTNLAADQTLPRAEACMAKMRAFFEEFHGKLEDGFFSHHPAAPD